MRDSEKDRSRTGVGQEKVEEKQVRRSRAGQKSRTRAEQDRVRAILPIERAKDVFGKFKLGTTEKKKKEGRARAGWSRTGAELIDRIGTVSRTGAGQE